MTVSCKQEAHSKENNNSCMFTDLRFNFFQSIHVFILNI